MLFYIDELSGIENERIIIPDKWMGGCQRPD
jgi:hypothetical protein